jgi:hypothetical protein
MGRLQVEPLTDDELWRLRRVLSGSTPADRLDWLEDLRLMFGPDHLKKCQDLKWRLEEAWKPLNSSPPLDR